MEPIHAYTVIKEVTSFVWGEVDRATISMWTKIILNEEGKLLVVQVEKWLTVRKMKLLSRVQIIAETL